MNVHAPQGLGALIGGDGNEPDPPSADRPAHTNWQMSSILEDLASFLARHGQAMHAPRSSGDR